MSGAACVDWLEGRIGGGEKLECAVIEASVSVGPGVWAYAFPLEISRFHTPNFDIYGPNNSREILAK